MTASSIQGAQDAPSLRVAREQANVTAFLLVELRRANRAIVRLREVALAARGGDAERARAALARLHAADLAPRRRRSPRAGRSRAGPTALGAHHTS